MLELLLLRHAKSSWDHPTTADHDRPLNDRGLAAAPMMGAYLAAEGLVPDLVLCSTATRTRATLDLVLPALAVRPAVDFESDLYLAEADVLLARLQRVPSNVRRVMMVGHNPGFQDFAIDLCGGGNKVARALLEQKFPTAALAVISFRSTVWADVAPGAGHLDRFVTPRGLAAERAQQGENRAG